MRRTSSPTSFPLLGDDDRRVAAAASSAVAGILTRLAPDDLAGLDPILRGSWSECDPHRRGWSRLTPEALDRQLDAGRLPPTLLGLASMHPDGHVREAALHRLAGRTDGSEVPYLLIRVNDWVPAVREVARAALRARLVPEYARHLVRNLPLVTRLSECRRVGHSSFVASVLERLRDPGSRPALLEGLASTDRAVRRACFRLAIGATDIPLAGFLGRGIRHDDPILRLWSARAARAGLATGDYLKLMPVMACDRFMPVRREALVGLVERCPDQTAPALRASLLDPHVSIREVARHHLEKTGGFDVRWFYRGAIRTGNSDVLPQAIAGLGETGTREDAGLISPWLAHPATKVRRAAVRALGRLDGDSHIDALLRALGDERSGVGRQAREALRARLRLVAGGRLWDVFERGGHPHARRYALALLAGLGKWAGLPYLIRACRDDDPEIASLAGERLRDWVDHFNRSFAVPSPADLRFALVALDESASTLPPGVEKLLRFHLEGW